MYRQSSSKTAIMFPYKSKAKCIRKVNKAIVTYITCESSRFSNTITKKSAPMSEKQCSSRWPISCPQMSELIGRDNLRRRRRTSIAKSTCSSMPTFGRKGTSCMIICATPDRKRARFTAGTKKAGTTTTSSPAMSMTQTLTTKSEII